jgi:GNAT superfamily N-acetyltransferase
MATEARRVSIQVRGAEPRDLPAVLELIEDLETLQKEWRVFPPRAGLVKDIEAMYRASIEDGNDLLLVAVADGDVLGTAFAHVVVPSTVSDEQAVELSGVIVRADHRGRGIGRALTTEAARFARERGIPRLTIKVFAQNEDGTKLWGGLGFHPRMLQMTIAPEELLSQTD